MIIDLRTEIEKRKTTPQKEEAIDILEKALKEVKDFATEECVVIYKQGNDLRYLSNKGSIITLLGMLELVKARLSDGI